jgi:hypothetical protein
MENTRSLKEDGEEFPRPFAKKATSVVEILKISPE